MRVFVTGATGHIGRRVVAELLRAGHEVSGLAQREPDVEALRARGVTPVLGSLLEPDGLAAAAAAADGVAHLAYRSGVAQEVAATTDLAAVEAMTNALAGSDRPLVVTSGTAGLRTGEVLTEAFVPDLTTVQPRMATEAWVIEHADLGVRTVAIRLPPTVHGPADVHGFIPQLMRIALDRGVSARVGDGTARWPAVHEDDAAVLYRRALESAPAGTRLHGVAESAVAYRDIAEAIGRRLGLGTTSIAAAEAVEHFGWLGSLVGLDMPATSEPTRTLLDWTPSAPGLLADIANTARPTAPGPGH